MGAGGEHLTQVQHIGNPTAEAVYSCQATLGQAFSYYSVYLAHKGG